MKAYLVTAVEDLTGKPFEEIKLSDITPVPDKPSDGVKIILGTLLKDLVQHLPQIAEAIVRAFMEGRGK